MTGNAEVLRVRDLHVHFGTGPARREVVKGVSFVLRAGECFAIVGESGSGKSVTARTVLGLTGDGSSVRAAQLELLGRDARRLRPREWRRVRGRRVGFVLQDALVSLDALRPVGREIAEPLKLHEKLSRRQRERRVIELLREVEVPEPELRARQLPSQLSGGLRQRALIASAIALDPDIVIADEPTTALDVTIQVQILALLERSKRRGRALIVISHDLAVVSRIADRVAVMNDGLIVEEGATAEVLSRPAHEYTRALLDAVPSGHPRGTRLSGSARRPDVSARAPKPVAKDGSQPIVQAQSLVKRYKGPDGRARTVVQDVSFDLRTGETLGVVGESGSGKTTVARIVLAVTEPDAGQVLVDAQPWSSVPERERRPRRRLITAIFQDPLSSFDPRWTVRRLLDDAVTVGNDGQIGRDERQGEVERLMGLVGLAAEYLERRPLQLSGGQRQRVAIARALAPRPAVIVCDEPVSALDVSVQAQILDLLADLQEQLRVSYLFISHDLGVVQHISDRVLVMSRGRVVERGEVDEIFHQPQHPYTRQLLSAVPHIDGVPNIDALPHTGAVQPGLSELR
jgi:peptide/nickel transport system ATP-binding protein